VLTAVADPAASGNQTGNVIINKPIADPTTDPSIAFAQTTTGFATGVTELVVDPAAMHNGTLDAAVTGMSEGNSLFVNQMFGNNVTATSQGNMV